MKCSFNSMTTMMMMVMLFGLQQLLFIEIKRLVLLLLYIVDYFLFSPFYLACEHVGNEITHTHTAHTKQSAIALLCCIFTFHFHSL